MEAVWEKWVTVQFCEAAGEVPIKKMSSLDYRVKRIAGSLNLERFLSSAVIDCSWMSSGVFVSFQDLCSTYEGNGEK